MGTDRERIKESIKDTKSLPAIPGVISKLNSMSANDKTSILEMAKVVNSDQVLSARVLRLANSPSFGFYRVTTISNAMILLGVDVVKSLALSSAIFDIMANSILGLWEHSLGTGVAANVIARRLHLPDCEEIATAALLHDIGKVVINLKFPEEFKEICHYADANQTYFTRAEMECIGTSHSEIGGWLVKSWFLPEKLSEPIACHHNVSQSLTHRTKTAVVHLADILTKANGFGNSGDQFVHAVQKVAWDQLGMTEQILAEIVDEFTEKIFETRNYCREMTAAS